MEDSGDPIASDGRHCSGTLEFGYRREVHARRISVYDGNDGMDFGSICVWIRIVPNPMRMGRRPLWPTGHADRGSLRVGRVYDFDQRASVTEMGLAVEPGVELCADSVVHGSRRGRQLPERE